MLSGYKTYITIAVMAIFNIAQEAGLTGIDETMVTATINTVMGALAFIFNKKGRDNLKGV